MGLYIQASSVLENLNESQNEALLQGAADAARVIFYDLDDVVIIREIILH